MEISYLSPILGAIIGYSTNWLAIKMIFRPYEEKRLFGVKVPFTPGVIAKEKTRMATKLGNTISSHLITSEEFSNYIKNDETKTLINSKVEEVILQNRDTTLGDVLFFLENDIVTEKIASSILNNIDKEEFVKNNKEKILNEICSEKTVQFINKNLENNLNNIVDYLVNLIKNGEFINDVEKEVLEVYNIFSKNENTILSYVNEQDYNKSKTHLQENLNGILEKVGSYVNSENFEEADKELLDILTKVLLSTVGPLVLNFVKPDTIYLKGKERFTEYISNEENNEEILEYIEKFVKFIGNTKISNATKIVSGSNVSSITNKTLTFFINNYSQKFATNFVKDKIVKKGVTKDDISKFLLKIRFDIYLEDMLSSYFHSLIEDVATSSNIDKIKNINIGSLISDENDISYFSEKVSEYILKFTKDNIENIVNSLNISKIVEDKINEMPLEETEKLILDVVKKELNTITYFGGVLGFIVGLIPFIIEVI